MKKLRVLFVLALALSIALASTSMAFATYGPTGPGPFGPQKDGVSGISVKPSNGANATWTYNNNTKTLTISGFGFVEVCWPGNQVSSVLQNGFAIGTYKVGTATCVYVFAPTVVQGIK